MGRARPRARARGASPRSFAWTGRALKGSGRTGRIVERDVRAAGADRPSAVRRLIGERMSASARTTAPVTLTTDADATALVRLRAALAAEAQAAGATPPSYTDCFVKLAAVALGEHPALNASLDGERIVQHRGHPRRRGRRHDAGTPRLRAARRAGKVAPGAGDRVGGAHRPGAGGHRVAGRAPRRHLHGLEPRRVRDRRLHADHQPAGMRDPRGRPDRRPRRGGRRGGRPASPPGTWSRSASPSITGSSTARRPRASSSGSSVSWSSPRSGWTGEPSADEARRVVRSRGTRRPRDRRGRQRRHRARRGPRAGSRRRRRARQRHRRRGRVGDGTGGPGARPAGGRRSAPISASPTTSWP